MGQADIVLIDPERLVYLGPAKESGYNPELKRSLEEMGQVEPIYVRQLANGNYGYLDGKQRVNICRELKKEVICELY